MIAHKFPEQGRKKGLPCPCRLVKYRRILPQWSLTWGCVSICAKSCQDTSLNMGRKKKKSKRLHTKAHSDIPENRGFPTSWQQLEDAFAPVSPKTPSPDIHGANWSTSCEPGLIAKHRCPTLMMAENPCSHFPNRGFQEEWRLLEMSKPMQFDHPGAANKLWTPTFHDVDVTHQHARRNIPSVLLEFYDLKLYWGARKH